MAIIFSMQAAWPIAYENEQVCTFHVEIY